MQPLCGSTRSSCTTGCARARTNRVSPLRYQMSSRCRFQLSTKGFERRSVAGHVQRIAIRTPA
eukprot:3293025-Prymnesium_polylepis.2